MSFEWYTEEDNRHEPHGDASQGRGRWTRRLSVVMVIVLIIAAAVFAGRELLGDRVDEVNSVATIEIESSVLLYRRAVAAQDAELLVTVLSGRDGEWAMDQQEQLLEGTLLVRDSVGLHWLPDESTILSATLAPELNRASVLVADVYTVSIGHDQNATVRLLRDEVYRRGESQWLMAPSDSEPEDERRTYVGQRVTLVYSESETNLAKRLAGDLDRKLVQLCAALADLRCEHPLQIELGEESALLAGLNRPSWLAAADTDLALPGFSLIGVPADEAAYQALFRAYAGAVLTRQMALGTGYDCCHLWPLFDTLAQRALADLGLATWDIDQADYLALLDDPTDILDAASEPGGPTVRLAPEANPAFAAIVEYLQDGPEPLSLVEMQRALMPIRSFDQWLRIVTGSEAKASPIGWVEYATARAATDQPASWPERSFATVCAPDAGPPLATQFVVYDSAAGTWEPVQIPDLLFPESHVALPGTAMTLIIGPSPQRSGSAMVLLSADLASATLVWEAPLQADSVGSVELLQVAGDRLILGLYSLQKQFAGVAAIDASTCTMEECRIIPVAGDRYALWSPDHGAAIVSDAPWPLGQSALPRVLSLANGALEGQAPLGAGTHPFWLDSNTFGFARTGASLEPEIVTATLKDPLPRIWLTAEDLLGAMFGTADEGTWSVAGIWSLPDRQAILIDLAAQSGAHAWLDVDRIGVPTLIAYGPLRLASVVFQPGGTMAVLHSEPSPEGAVQLLLLDVDSASEHRYASFARSSGAVAAWSGDGRWLLIDQGLYLQVIDIVDMSRRVVRPPDGQCRHPAWLD